MSPTGAQQRLRYAAVHLLDCWLGEVRGAAGGGQPQGRDRQDDQCHLAGLRAGPRGRVLLVDADPQASALAWAEEADFPFPTVGLPVRDLHKQLGKIAADYDHVVIDTPPGHEALVRGAVLAADTVLIPLSPAGVELRQVGPTFALLAELEPHTPALRVLLTQVQARTVAGRSARTVLTAAQVPLLAAEVPQRQSYRTAFGALPPTQHYESVVAELLETA